VLDRCCCSSPHQAHLRHELLHVLELHELIATMTRDVHLAAAAA
jgi:hypothetical protein